MSITAVYPALAAVFSTIILKAKNPPRVWLSIILRITGAFVIGYAPEETVRGANFHLGIGLSRLGPVRLGCGRGGLRLRHGNA
jgi:drug/metabolite transporter (DMT)-like permease